MKQTTGKKRKQKRREEKPCFACSMRSIASDEDK